MPESLFLITLQASRLQLYQKKRFWHRCFPVNFAKFLRAPFFTENLCGCIWSSNDCNRRITCLIYCFTVWSTFRIPIWLLLELNLVATANDISDSKQLQKSWFEVPTNNHDTVVVALPIVITADS